MSVHGMTVAKMKKVLEVYWRPSRLTRIESVLVR